MCYNVLCDKYATRQMYGYCPSWALDWEYRKKGILEEIRHYAADIISLQVRERRRKKETTEPKRFLRLAVNFFFLFAGSRNGSVLQFFSAGAEKRRLRRDFLPQVQSQDHVRKR